jgi:hypothetical protein
MIKELFYEWTLFCIGFLTSDYSKKGFYDNKRIYERKRFLKWKVIKSKSKTAGGKLV